jgi:hypothetical protein
MSSPRPVRRVDGPASHSNPTSTHPGLDRPPRHRYQHRCPRRVRGPAEMLVWEDVLPSEVRCGPLEDLVLPLQAALITAQCGELSLVRAGQPRIAAALISVGLGYQIPQTRLTDRQLLGHHSDRSLAHTGQLDRSTAELRRVRCRHGRILPGGRSHLRSGVRAGGSSSVLGNGA